MIKITTRLGKEVDVNDDYTIDQKWQKFTAEEHARWDTLYARQRKLLKGRACSEFLRGMDMLRLSQSGIPHFGRLSERLEKATGWTVVAVPDLVPDEVFFEHLANRRFPASDFIRSKDQLDYIQEPDVFHDVFGHVPMLAHPVFADYMEAYGKGGLKAAGKGVLHNLARLYWYTVEFGLINRPDEGMQIYGAGIVSSKTESVFCLEDASPNRIHFELLRVMRSKYRIDDFQQVYFVIGSFEELFEATLQEFGPIYQQLQNLNDLEITSIVEADQVYTEGTQAYAQARAGRLAL
ncbi:MAG: phenylalanine 4-monooxygenase [Proteobacteria bacterium]|nr:phenylalanine 4-monooxygenase [Pseudomonadota bacterium]